MLWPGKLPIRSGKCPHKNIIYCPLYWASHGAGGGCDDGRIDEGGCAVDRGLNYATAVEKLKLRFARDVAEMEWAEARAEAAAQRDRNMRLNGVH